MLLYRSYLNQPFKRLLVFSLLVGWLVLVLDKQIKKIDAEKRSRPSTAKNGPYV
eukprot:m.242526 g.242526  ORF g.242526 m.242526 type:complete len:54 (-) comp17135_c13_seq1:311-472(-)